MKNKTFELAVILSLAHHHLILDVEQEQVQSLIEHVTGKQVQEHEIGELSVQVSAYLLDKYPKIADAVRLTSHVLPDNARYQKLIDLCRKFHDIEAMAGESHKAVSKEESLAQA